MNILDLAILALLAVSVIWGIYRGFIQTALNILGGLGSLLLAGIFGPRLAQTLYGNRGVTDMIATFTDSLIRVHDSGVASTNVAGIGKSTIDTVLTSVKLPAPLDAILRENLTSQAFASAGSGTVNDYVSATIATAAIQILCFLVCFAVFYLVLSILVSLLQHVFHFPLLKQLDWLAGGLFGLGRGVLIVCLLFLLVPLIRTVIPLKELDALISSSTLAGIFSSSGFFRQVAGGLL
jgi:uncharacterized membrane protein required for colicin V production